MGSVKQSGIRCWQLKIINPITGDVLKIADYKSLQLAQSALYDLQSRYIMWNPWQINLTPIYITATRDSDYFYTPDALLTKKLREVCAQAKIARCYR